MAWDGVPWFVGGGAEHSPEVARLMAYAAFNGNEGLIGPGDLRVTEASVPDDTVRVAPGACSIVNRASAQKYQAYAARLPSEDTVAISPTDSTGGRSDLIVARVEDPFLSGEPWAEPSDPASGPYIHTRVIPDVPAGTTSIRDVEPESSGITLARVDLPVSTGTVTQSMITDLREVANPNQKRLVKTWTPAGHTLINPEYVRWPNGASWSIRVPEWATRALVSATWGGVRVSGNVYGGVRARLGGAITEPTAWNFDVASGVDNVTLFCADEIALDSADRGSVVTLEVQGRKTGGDGSVAVTDVSSFHIDVEFIETAD